MRRLAAFVRSGVRKLGSWAELASDERQQRRSRRGHTRLNSLAHGFHSVSPEIYDFRSRPRALFLSDLERLRTGRIDFGTGSILCDKILFERMFSNWLPVPPNIAIVRRGALVSLLPASDPFGADRHAPDWPSIKQRCPHGVVAKPVNGGSGRGIVVIRPEGDRFRFNEELLSNAEVARRLPTLDRCVLVPFVPQAEFNARLHPATTNTIRVLTMVDPREEVAFIACAVQRIGVAASIPVDNWTRGGLSARIDLDSGRLGRGATKPKSGPPQWHTAHPETGVQVEGEVVPNWHRIRDDLIRVSSLFPMIPYIGWDVIPTDEGYSVIEGNFRPDVNLLQIHEPLLATERVRSFYRHHRIISMRRAMEAERSARTFVASGAA